MGVMWHKGVALADVKSSQVNIATIKMDIESQLIIWYPKHVLTSLPGRPKVMCWHVWTGSYCCQPASRAKAASMLPMPGG